jgi:single-strand DNA-binding protein
MNKVIINGNIVREPELKNIGDTCVCEFTIANNKKIKDKEYTVFIDCSAWGKNGETIARFFHKGSPILVEGGLRQDKWEKDGQNFSKISINLFTFDFMERLSSGENTAKPPVAQNQTKSESHQPRQENSTDDLDSEIPF